MDKRNGSEEIPAVLKHSIHAMQFVYPDHARYGIIATSHVKIYIYRLMKEHIAVFRVLYPPRGKKQTSLPLNIESLERRVLLSGVTVVTHGFQPSDTGGDSLKPLAKEIQRQTGGCLLDYELGDSTLGTFRQNNCNDLNSQEVVVLFDWATESNEESNGWAEAAGDALFSLLIQQGLADPTAGEDNREFHFIGHSFGTVVTSEVVERFAAIGIPVDHVTYLDPHDFDQDISLGNETEQELWTNGLPHGANRAERLSYGASVWDNVEFADVYYQVRREPFVSLVPAGRPIPGAYNVLLDDELPDGFTLVQDHSFVWQCFYLGTVMGHLPDDCPDPEVSIDFESTGFAFSRNANNQLARLDPNFYETSLNHKFSSRLLVTKVPGTKRWEPNPIGLSSLGLSESQITNGRWDSEWNPMQIVQGDFESTGPNKVGSVHPGYSHHGGGGAASFDSGSSLSIAGQTVSRHVVLKPNGLKRTHNSTYLPVTNDGYLAVRFEALFESGDTGDQLVVMLGSDPVGNAIPVPVQADTRFHTYTISIPEEIQGTVRTLTLELTNPDDVRVSSRVRIDNLGFVDSDNQVSAVNSNGTLVITGDRNDNDIRILVRGERFLVRGRGATRVNGVDRVHEFNGINRGILIQTARGNDRVIVNGSLSGAAPKTGNWRIVSGAGQDYVELRNVIAGGVQVRPGTESDHVNVIDAIIAGEFSVSESDTGSSGRDIVSFQSSRLKSRTFLRTARGADHVQIDDSRFDGAVVINTGGTADRVDIETRATDAASPQASRTDFTKRVTIKTGSGNDSVRVGVAHDAFRIARFLITDPDISLLVNGSRGRDSLRGGFLITPNAHGNALRGRLVTAGIEELT